MMYGWIPVGHNIAKTGAISDVCPCCVAPDETLEHLFICKNPQMTTAKANGIRDAIRKCGETKIPNRVSSAFYNLLLDYTHGRDTEIKSDMHPSIKRAIHSQQQIGIHLFSRGFISTQWRTAMEETGTTYPQHKTETLLRTLWMNVFEQMWKCRNDILHHQDNHRSASEDKELVRQLRWYKANTREAFTSSQRHFAEINLDDVSRWTTQTKRAYVDLLNTAHLSKQQAIKRSTQKSKTTGKAIQSVLPEFWLAMS